jgi:uncharacterized alkaline shock family protein YloU
MSVFNRIVMTLLFAGLFVLGVYTVVYSFDLFGRSLTSLPISDFSSGLQDFVTRVENGNLSVLTIITLALMAILGLIWFVAELRPSTPSRVRMGKGTYLTRSVVREEVSRVAEQVPGVLGSSVGVKARRSPGAQVDLEAKVRPGEDLETIRSDVRTAVQEHLSEQGLPVSKLNVKLVEADPRQTKTRVQ